MTRADIATGYVASISVGLGLLWLPPQGRLIAFTAIVAMDFAHTLSPMAAAWSHRGFRAVMLREWWRYLAMPVIALGVALAFPLREVMTVYWGWNIWHFSMQNYGVYRLCSGPVTIRWERLGRNALMAVHPQVSRKAEAGIRSGSLQILILGMTGFLMVGLPLLAHSFTLFLVMTAIISINHWMTELGLTARISGHPVLFLAGVLAAGCAAFVWTVPTSAGTMVNMNQQHLLAFRAGLGWVHFLTDANMYRMSRPEVRNTIGVALA